MYNFNWILICVVTSSCKSLKPFILLPCDLWVFWLQFVISLISRTVLSGYMDILILEVTWQWNALIQSESKSRNDHFITPPNKLSIFISLFWCFIPCYRTVYHISQNCFYHLHPMNSQDVFEFLILFWS